MYEKKVSTSNPGFIQFVLDFSGSTADKFPGTTDPVYKWIERYCGIILEELTVRSTDVDCGEAKVKPRYYTSFILYGSKPQHWGQAVMDIKSAEDMYTGSDNSFGLGGQLGGTDAKAAFELAYKNLAAAVKSEQFAHSFPPMLFHLTDGQSSTDAGHYAEKIQQLSTDDGNVLVVNAFIGAKTNLAYKCPEDFPGYSTADEAGPDDDNIRLFNMSSQMPEVIYENLVAQAIFPQLRKDAHLFFDVRTRDMLKHVIQVVGSIPSNADRMER